MKRLLVLILLSLSAVLVLVFQNCAPTSFKKASEPASTGLSIGAAGTTTSDGAPSSPPTPIASSDNTTVPLDPVAQVPKYKLFIETCQAGDMCKVQVVLDRKANADFSFHWETNDEKFKEDPKQFAEPNFHYVPATGTVLIKKGEQETQLFIKSIRWVFVGEKDSILIPLNIDNCIYDAKRYSCESLKAPKDSQ